MKYIATYDGQHFGAHDTREAAAIEAFETTNARSCSTCEAYLADGIWQPRYTDIRFVKRWELMPEPAE